MKNHRGAQVAAALTVMGATALLTAACGSGGSQNAGGPANSSTAVAYSQCVRAHGVPNFPDPDNTGQIPKAAVITAFKAVGDATAKAATAACESMNPADQQSPTLTAQQQQDYLRAAACIRSHGITGFPDPTFPGGKVSFNIPASIDTSSTQFVQAAQACRSLIPAGLPYHGPGSGS